MLPLVPHHIAVTVADIEGAADLVRREFGAGPFTLLEHVGFDELTLADGSVGRWDHSLAFSALGDQLIELSVTHSAEPPGLLAEMDSYRPLSHFGFVVDDLAAESRRLAGGSAELLFTARGGPVELAFHRSPVYGLIELLQDCPAIQESRAEIIARAKE